MLGEQLQIDDDVLFTNNLSDPLTSETMEDKRQSSFRRVVHFIVKLRPASTSQRSFAELSGRVKDLSTSGCGLILDYPPCVGDLYRFQVVDGNDSFLEGVLVRCVRCHFIDEDLFEAGFQFLTPLPQTDLADGLI